jgi:hypothetical protein
MALLVVVVLDSLARWTRWLLGPRAALSRPAPSQSA